MTAVILLWLKLHWRETLVAALLGAVVVAGAMLYASWHLRGAKIERLGVKLETATARSAQLEDMLARSNQSAHEWQAAALACDAGTTGLQLEAERHRQAVELERRKLEAERDLRRAAEGRLADAITATGCEDAVRQMAEVLR